MNALRFNLKGYRTKKNITQNQLATQLGVSQAMISQYERNWSSVKNSTIQKISTALGVDPLELFMDDNGESAKDRGYQVDFYSDDYEL